MCFVKKAINSCAFFVFSKPADLHAKTRCRYVAGEKSLMEEFEALLKDFLFNKPIGDKESKREGKVGKEEKEDSSERQWEGCGV